MLHYNAPDEQTILIVRKHWFILLRSTLGLLVLFLFPFVLLKILPAIALFGGTALPPIPLPEGVVSFLTVLWALVMWIKLFGIWTNYYLDTWIITDKRVVAIDQIRFFNRQMSIFRLERIQDIIVNVNGFLPTVLNFGDIQIETAGEEEDFIIKGIPRPQHMKDVIMRQHDAVVERENRS